MSKIPCYAIGRDAAAAVTVSHTTVSRLHAEAVPLPDGRLYVTDCASTNGTFINEDGQWRRISQDFASPGARLRFGDVEVSVPDLLTQTSRLQGSSPVGQTGTSSAEQEEQEEPLDVSGGVALDPETGEPVALASTADEGKA